MNSKPSSLQKLQPKFRLGQAGEQLATRFLIQKKYHIIDRNVRWKQLEVDIIAIDRDTNELVFIEVKTRSNKRVEGYLAIGQAKLRALARFAALYQARKKPSYSYRIDAISIVGTSIEHYQNISWWR